MRQGLDLLGDLRSQIVTSKNEVEAGPDLRITCKSIKVLLMGHLPVQKCDEFSHSLPLLAVPYPAVLLFLSMYWPLAKINQVRN